MKNFKRIISLFLLAVLCLGALTSCMETKSKAVATYDGSNHIYEDDSDFSDFYNLNRYFYSYHNGDKNTSTSEYNDILSDAVKETITVRVFEAILAENGIAIDMETVLAEADIDRASFDTSYDGGFAGFCEDWGVSENVFILYNKYEALKDAAEALATDIVVTDAEAKAYYDKNPEKYFKTPHYDINTIFLQVLDPSNEQQMHEAYDDAMLYIDLLNSGRSWESVKDAALIKYNEGRGMIFSSEFSCLNHVHITNFLNILDIDTAIQVIEDEFTAANGMSFAEMFPAGFEAYAEENELEPETKEYNKALELYMSHASTLYNLQFQYAISTYWAEGTTYEKPIYNAVYNSYVVVTFTRMEEENVTITFEEAKEDIAKILEKSKREKFVDNYISQLMDKLKVQIQYK